MLSVETKRIHEKSNDLIDLISEFKKELIDIYEYLKKLKRDIISFKNYEGIFRNLMCKNTEYKLKDKNECNNSEKLKKDY